MTRIIRIIGFFITIMAPALYVAATTYHQELIPTSLLITFAQAREGVPFPAFVESLIMIITFEILREAGIRLPRPVGQALSIVGAFVIGESAVSAGIIGAPMVIVVAITAVSGFLVPAQNNSVVALRYIMLILGAALGASALHSSAPGTCRLLSRSDTHIFADVAIRVGFKGFRYTRRCGCDQPPEGMAVDEQRRNTKSAPNGEAGRSQD